MHYIVVQILLSTHKKPGEIEPLLTEYMGMTDELNGETISEFVSLGVKKLWLSLYRWVSDGEGERFYINKS